MTATDIVAWYAAGVATAVFGWDIVKWFRNGPRLRINAMCNISYTDARVIERHQLEGGGEAATLADYCHIEVLNVGGQPTTLINIEIANTPKTNGLRISYSGPAFTVHAGSKALPALLGTGEMWSARVEMSQVQSIAEHGAPAIRIRASHSPKLIRAAIDMKREVEGMSK